MRLTSIPMYQYKRKVKVGMYVCIRVFCKWLKWIASRQGDDKIDYGVGVDGFHEVRLLAGGVDGATLPLRGEKVLAADTKVPYLTNHSLRIRILTCTLSTTADLYTFVHMDND